MIEKHHGWEVERGHNWYAYTTEYRCWDIKTYRWILENFSGFNRKQIEYFIEHEGAHFKTAQRVGASPSLVLKEREISFLFFGVQFRWCGVRCLQSETDKRDLLEILLAPREPSPRDLRQAEEIRVEMRRALK